MHALYAGLNNKAMFGPWQRFQALPPHKRVLLGVTGMVLSSLGLWFSEKIVERRTAPHEIAIEGAKSLGLMKREGAGS